MAVALHRMGHDVPPNEMNLVATSTALRGRVPFAHSIETPQLSVVVVNFCQWKNTARLVKQLHASEAVRRGAAEIVVVDNHSPSSKLTGRLRKMSGVTVFLNEYNQGFSKAVNRGSKVGRGEWILLLNPDVTVDPGFLDEVLETAQRWAAHDPRAGVIGFRMKNRDGSDQSSSGPFPTLLRTLSGLFLPRSRRKCRHRTTNDRKVVPWATGGCLLVRRDCFEHMSGMDESYFLYYEDVDFCRRAHRAGWTIWFDPELQVTHHWPLHVRQVPPPLRLVTRHALLTYARKHWPTWQTKFLSTIVWCEASFRTLAAAWRGDEEAAACYGQLRRMVVDLAKGRLDRVAKKIRAAADKLDSVAAAQDGKTK